MSKRKKTIVIIAVCITVFAVAAVCFGFLINSNRAKTYSSAKKECERVLDKHQDQIEKIAADSLKSNKNETGKFKDYSYGSYQDEGIVVFYIDSQGRLGGQYWDLVYTQDGTLYGETESYLYKQTNGNNIIRAEKINSHWWYLWTDYDGTERSYQ